MMACSAFLRCRHPTKPQLASADGVEKLLWAIWCGREIPKASGVNLPYLVDVAQKDVTFQGAYKLIPQRLW